MKSCLRLARHLLCVLLACVMAFSVSIRIFAASENPDAVLAQFSPEELEWLINLNQLSGTTGGAKLYVSEVQVATGETESEAKSALHKAGFLVYDRNLNEGAGGYRRSNAKYSYMGYKLTTDETKAITDLRLMDQDGGYEEYSYYDEAKKQFSGLSDTVAGMQAAANEVAANFRSGKKSAAVAMDGLNIFCVPKTSKDTNGILFGEGVLNGAFKADNYEEFLLILNTLVMSVISSRLTIGVIDSTLLETEIKGVGVKSTTGVTGYSMENASGMTLQDAFDGFLSGVTADQVPADDSETTDAYLDQIYVLKAAMNGGLSAAASDYLKNVQSSVRLNPNTNTLEPADGYSLYTFLGEATPSQLALFFDGLPDVCGGCHFTDVVEIAAHEKSHVLPAKLTTEYRYDVNWVNSIKNYVAGTFDPYASNSQSEHQSEVNLFSGDIDRFAANLEAFFTEYETGKKKYEKTGLQFNPISGTEPVDRLEEMMDGTDTDSDVDPALYMGIYAFLDSFKLTLRRGGVAKEMTLADYFGEIVNAYRIASDEDAEDAAKQHWLYSALTYPIVRALTPGQLYSCKTSSLAIFFADSMLTEKELYATGVKQQTLKTALLAETKTSAFSVWNGTNKELLEAEYVAMTSDQVRRDIEKAQFDDATSNYMTLDKKCVNFLLKLGLVSLGFVAGTCIVLTATGIAGGIGIVTWFTAVGQMFLGTFMFGPVLTGCCVLGTTAVVGLIVVLLIALVAFFMWLGTQIRPDPPEYTQIPTIMMDCTTDKNNNITGVAYYYVVRDPQGAPADINGYTAHGWTALYYTSDPKAGKPLETGPSGSFFGSVTGSMVKDDRGQPLAKFGQFAMFNLNTNCYEDDVEGIYLWFYTDDSLNGRFNTKVHGKYVEKLVIGIDDTPEGAEGYVLKQSGTFLLTADLAPDNDDYFVALGYTTTNDPSEALRDIRVVYGTTAEKITFGSVSYANITPASLRTTPLKTFDSAVDERKETPFSWTIFTTKDPIGGETVGPPILSAGLAVVNTIGDIPSGSEVVTMMNGGPFDFASWDKEEKDTFATHRFLTYKYDLSDPAYEILKTNTTEYLGGIAFFSGSTDWLGRSDTPEYTLEKYAESMGYRVMQLDLTAGILNDPADVTYIAYYLTKNPYHAITDLGIFTAEPKSGSVPDSLVSGGVGFVASPVFSQGDMEYYDKSGRMRLMRKSHAYFTAIDDEAYHTGWGKSYDLVSRGLYAAGYRGSAVRPLTLSDVLFSLSKGKIPADKGNNSGLYYLNTYAQNKSAGSGIGTGWKTVHPLDQYYYDEYNEAGNLTTSFNMGLGECSGRPTVNGMVFNLFVRNETIPDRVRGKYVSSAELVSAYDAYCSYDAARLQAMQLGTEIVNLDAPLRIVSSAYPDLVRESPVFGPDERLDMTYGDGCFFISVSYTNNSLYGLGGIRVLEQKTGVQLESGLTLPLDEDKRTFFSKGNLALKKADNPDDYVNDKGERLTDEQISKIKNSRAGFVLYTTKNGTKINRLFVQQTPIAGVNYDYSVWHDPATGEAYYYLPAGDTQDPFCLTGYGSNLNQYICAVRLDQSADQSGYRYIENITIERVSRHDDLFRADEAELGAKDFPFYVEYDLFDGMIGSRDSLESAVVGIKRTSSVSKAIKDIKISSEDHGFYFLYQNVVYQRANAEPLYLEKTGNEPIYLYYTKDTGDGVSIVGAKISWDDLINDPKTDWTMVDWRMVDMKTIDYNVFSTTMHAPVGTESERTYWLVVNPDQAKTQGLKPSDFALTDFGLYVEREDAVHWSSLEGSTVADGTAMFEVKSFDGSMPAIRMFYTNPTGQNYDEKLNEYFKTYYQKLTSGGVASVFTEEGSVVIVVTLLAIAGLAVAAAVIVSKKRKKSDS